MRYEMAILAALVQEDSPNTQSIVTATGISERKVQEVLNALQSTMDIGIARIKSGKRQALYISSWGVFGNGERLIEKLKTTDLAVFKQHRQITTKALPGKTQSSRMVTLEEKRDYYNQVKLKNYRDSMRLEGFSVEDTPLPSDKQEREALRKSLIAKYKASGYV
ncbi:YhfG family protein [Brenneria tiliae]|uniref:YhfG family protein n=1 Tax=Brenneria tiliae TaxID=2914984 RepID=A0ABT0MTH1_9GAMM|nr:YhfG family protein [Brenneria tiliae]MCL2893129.1 YhfG family protein [Brenneria tiliae]